MAIVSIADLQTRWTGVGPWLWLAARALYLPLYGFGVFPTAVYDTFSPRVTGNVVQVLQVTVAPGSPGFARDGSYAAVDVTNY